MIREKNPCARREWRGLLAVTLLGLMCACARSRADEPARRLLYVAVPGIRNYLEYGGHGVLVFDIGNGHEWVRRIAARGLDPRTGEPLNVKGIAASARTGRLYVSTTQSLQCFDLRTDALLWEKTYDGGCDRMSLSPDVSRVILPSFEAGHWHVVDGLSGEVLGKVNPDSGAHNTIVGFSGERGYLAGLRSPLLAVLKLKEGTLGEPVGPFSAPVRPFTVNGAETLVFVNVNDLLGFEVGDLRTGKKLARVEVAGFAKGPIKRHGCPSHGIGLTPDERELWVCDAHNQRLHIFDATRMPPKQVDSIALRDEPGWVTFSLDGTYAYPSTGEVVEVKTRRIVAQLRDEQGVAVQSEKMVEVDFSGATPVAAGDQFGLGRLLP
jgi:DNA-binding beta-propeller fold protein YncE